MIVTLDWETHWGDDYTLSKMTTEEYVRDPRFKAHGLAIKFDAAPARWFPPDVLQVPRMRSLIESSGVLCHHAQFDGLILAHHYDLRPALWYDTLSMARIAYPHERHGLDNLSKLNGLPGKSYALQNTKGMLDIPPSLMPDLARYACQDADNTYAIFQLIKDLIPREEYRLIDMTVRLFTEPRLGLDRDHMEAYYERTKRDKDDLMRRLDVDRSELQSAEKFAAKLRGLDVEPPTKAGKHGVIYAFAKTDAGMRELVEHDDERVAALAACRLGIKSSLNETRCERLLSSSGRGPLPVYLRWAGAHTTRWSGGDSLNWQNFPRGGDIRRSVLPPEGTKAVVADLSQVECRGVNWLAGQTDVLDRFRSGADPYIGNASLFYGRPITKADKMERHLGKTIELGCGYGMGADKFRDTCARGPLGGPPIHLSAEESEAAVKLYRGTHKAVQFMWYNTAEDAINVLINGGTMQWGPLVIEKGVIWLPNGLPLWYDYIETDGDGDKWFLVRGKRTKLYGGKLCENVTQAFCRVIFSQAVLRISEKYQLVNAEHDAGWWVVPVDDLSAVEYICAELSKTPDWAPGLPLAAEGWEAERFAR